MAINRDKILESAQKLVEKKKYDKAVIELRQVTAADPGDVRTLQKIAELQARQALWAEAVDTYETIGKLYTHNGFALKAVAVYKQVRDTIALHAPELGERYGHIAPKLAGLYIELGLNGDALALLAEVAARHHEQGNEHEATEVYRQIAVLDANNPIPHLRLAEALSRARDAAGAAAEFRAAADLLIAAERRDDAIQVLERLLQHKPDLEQARRCAELYLSRNRPPHDIPQALTKLQICYQSNPRDIAVLGLIARSFEMLGQGNKALDIRREISRITSGGP